MKTINSFLILAVLFVFSCTKNSDVIFSNDVDVHIIKVDNIEGSEYVEKIQAYIPEASWSQTIIAETHFENNGFELHLPFTIPDNSLVPLTNIKEKGISVSNPKAKLAFMGLKIISTNKSFYHILMLDNSHRQPDNMATKEVVYIYVDCPVRLSGKVTWKGNPQPPWSSLALPYQVEITTTYRNLTLVAGWNMVCMEKSFESIRNELKKQYYTYSNKNTSDCKWNFIVHHFPEY